MPNRLLLFAVCSLVVPPVLAEPPDPFAEADLVVRGRVIRGSPHEAHEALPTVQVDDVLFGIPIWPLLLQGEIPESTSGLFLLVRREEGYRILSAPDPEEIPGIRERIRRTISDRVPALLGELDADSYETREDAAREIARLGFSAEEPLEEALGNASPEARSRIRSILDRIGEAKERLSLRLTLEVDREVRPGQSLSPHVWIENRGEEPIWIAHPVDGSGSHWRFPHLDLIAWQETGEGRIDSVFRGGRCGNVNGLRLDDFSRLEPGDRIDPIEDHAWIRLDRFDLGTGVWYVQAVYRYEFSTETDGLPMGEPTGETLNRARRAVAGEFRSEPIRVEVRE